MLLSDLVDNVDNKVWYMNLFSSFDLALFVLSSYVGFYHIILFASKRDAIEHLHFSLLCFAIASNDIACIGLYNSSSIGDGELWQTVQFFCASLISIELVNFTYCLVQKKSDIPKKTFLTLLWLLLILGLFLNQTILDRSQPMERLISLLGMSITYYEYKPGIIWNLLFIVQIIGMFYLYYLLIYDFTKKNKKDLLPLLIGFTIFFISGIVDMLISTNRIRFLYTVEYAFLSMILLMDYILIKRFLKVYNDVESLNKNLEKKVSERTLELQKMAEEITEVNKVLQENNISLTELAERDSMTRLLNHAAFIRRLSELYNLSQRQVFPICVMILDIDYFKKINDTFGHQTGDLVIMRVSETLNAVSRNFDFKAHFNQSNFTLDKYDITGRYGGDEFAIALPFCGEKESKNIANRICESIRSLVFNTDAELHITSSIGCAILLNHSACTDELALIRIADQALYRAKEKGRDQVDFIILE
jgi:GGDEF domain-containing protein